jgi:hypothetical protein
MVSNVQSVYLNVLHQIYIVCLTNNLVMTYDCCYKLYMHINKTNGKVYVGQTKKSYCRRWRNGKGYSACSRFAKSIEKYGWDGFEHIPLIEGLSKSESDYFEQFFIEFFDSQNPEFGYNLTAGGDENPMDNLVVRTKYYESMKQMHADPEWQKNHREFLKKLHSDPKWQEKIREANQKRCKKVLCVETKIVYDSLKEAVIAVNLKTHTPISMCCSGKRKTAGGYHWEYV